LAVRGIQLIPGEKMLVDIRPHWSFLSGPLFVSMLAIAIGVLLDVAVPHTSVTLHWVEGLVVAVPCVWLAVRVVRWRMTRLALTSERIIEQWGVVSRRQSELAMSTIAAVTVFQSPLRRVVGTGRLEVEGWEGADIRWIEDVRKPVILQRIINRRLLPHPPGY
jgi:membrane protein YdbS with pleckstrin-like domain